MQLITLATLSSVAFAGFGAASNHGGGHHSDGIQRRENESFHRALVRDIRTSLRSTNATSLSTRSERRKKRAGAPAPLQKRCLVSQNHSTGSSSSASPTPTGSGSSNANTRTTTSSNSSPTGVHDSAWNLRVTHQGSSFFDGWEFWSYSDPTHGTVDYQSRENAFQKGMAYVNEQGNAVMTMETTQEVSDNRAAIRIHDNFVFNTGTLLALDAVHMPVGCGTWPAFWSNGPDWPNKGEIDILEGVNDGTFNQASIHTGSGCSIPQDTSRSSGVLVGGNNCASYESNNSGCGFQDYTPNNYGDGFNNNGGGVYAMQWTTDGISVWFHPRDEIPSDLTNDNPHPENWATPTAFWSSQNCNMDTFFQDHFAIFTNTLCGDWAGNVWNAGCAAKTGVSTCQEYVRKNGNAFANAYWEVSYVKIYQY